MIRVTFVVDRLPRRVAIIRLIFNYLVFWELKPVRAETAASLFYPGLLCLLRQARAIRSSRIKDNRTWQPTSSAGQSPPRRIMTRSFLVTAVSLFHFQTPRVIYSTLVAWLHRKMRRRRERQRRRRQRERAPRLCSTAYPDFDRSTMQAHYYRPKLNGTGARAINEI